MLMMISPALAILICCLASGSVTSAIQVPVLLRNKDDSEMYVSYDVWQPHAELSPAAVAVLDKNLKDVVRAIIRDAQHARLKDSARHYAEHQVPLVHFRTCPQDALKKHVAKAKLKAQEAKLKQDVLLDIQDHIERELQDLEDELRSSVDDFEHLVQQNSTLRKNWILRGGGKKASPKAKTILAKAKAKTTLAKAKAKTKAKGGTQKTAKGNRASNNF